MTNAEIDVHSIDSFELDTHLLLLKQNADRLQILNPLASSIWQLKRSGMDNQKIAGEISKTFEIPIELALHDIESISAQWIYDLTKPAEEIPTEKYLPLPEKLTHWQANTSILLAFPRFTAKLSFDSQIIADKVRTILPSLEVTETAKVDVCLDIISKSDTYLIVKDNLILKHTETENHAAQMACHQLVCHACKQDNWLVVLHAAGVSWQGYGLIFPALGGSGKTTLTAALIQQGFDYINDDVIPLLRNTHELVALPLSLSIKSGSWPVLQPLYPELEALEIFGNQERLIKYLPPPPIDHPAQTYYAKHIILPDYRPGATTQLKPLSTVSALQAIIEGESLLHLPLNKEDIAALVKWISPLSCHRLSYDKLEPAVALLRQFCIEHHTP